MGNLPKAERHRLIKLAHIAKRQLGLKDDDYRAVISAATGRVDSCGDCTDLELAAVMRAFKRLGFKVGSGKKLSPPSRHRQEKRAVDKLRALWIDGHKRGLIRDGSEPALAKWAAGMSGIEKLEWMSDGQIGRTIEGLKQMLARLEGQQNGETDGDRTD